jgi:hypothetical protein
LFAVIVHGDTVGAETLQRSLPDWGSDMHLVSAGATAERDAELDAYVGHYEPYATSHEALDRDDNFQEEVRNATRTLMEAVDGKRKGLLVEGGTRLREPRPK